MQNPFKIIIQKFQKPLPLGVCKISGIIENIRACRVNDGFYVVIFEVAGMRFSSVFSQWWARNGDLIDVTYAPGWQDGTYSALHITNYDGAPYRGAWRICARIFVILCCVFLAIWFVYAITQIIILHNKWQNNYNSIFPPIFVAIVFIVWGLFIINSTVQKLTLLCRFTYHKIKFAHQKRKAKFQFPLKKRKF